MEAVAQKSVVKARQPALLTFDEYLKKEEKALHKHEFHNGKRKKMPGGTLSHTLLATNLLYLLNNLLYEADFENYVLNSDMKVHVPAYNKTFYPDGLIILGKPEYYRGSHSVILNPTVLFEVLSKSTELYDRNEKFTQYQTIPSLKEYVLINQSAAEVEVFFRENPTDNHWKFTKTTGMEGEFRINSVGCDLKMGELYRRVSELW